MRRRLLLSAAFLVFGILPVTAQQSCMAVMEQYRTGPAPKAYAVSGSTNGTQPPPNLRLRDRTLGLLAGPGGEDGDRKLRPPRRRRMQGRRVTGKVAERTSRS